MCVFSAALALTRGFLTVQSAGIFWGGKISGGGKETGTLDPVFGVLLFRLILVGPPFAHGPQYFLLG